MAVLPVAPVEHAEVHLGHGIQKEPRKVAWREPFPDVWWKQVALLSVVLYEVVGHASLLQIVSRSGAAYGPTGVCATDSFATEIVSLSEMRGIDGMERPVSAPTLSFGLPSKPEAGRNGESRLLGYVGGRASSSATPSM